MVIVCGERATAAPPAAAGAAAATPATDRPAIGAFAGRADVGKVGRPGSAVFDPAKGEYHVTGSGENMWKAADAFYFVHSTASGDLSIEAEVRLEGAGGNPHRKAGLIVRQGLGADAPYADVVVHGDGSVYLQYRAEPGGQTANAPVPAPATKPATAPTAAAGQAATPSPLRLRLERRGETFAAFVVAPGEAPRPAGSVRLRLNDPVYVGLAVCSHDAAASATAAFKEVTLKVGAERPARNGSRDGSPADRQNAQ